MKKIVKFNFKMWLYSLPLPIDVLRIIKEFVGVFPKPVKVPRDFEFFTFRLKNRHRKLTL